MAKIPVPTTLDLEIRHYEAVPYKSFTPVLEGDSTSAAQDAVRRHCTHFALAMFKLVLPGAEWKTLKTELHNPKYSVAVLFTAGKNCLKVLHYSAGTEFYIVDDVIYRRVTWSDIGISGKQCGLSSKVNRKSEKNFTYFLRECSGLNRGPLHSAILSGLEQALIGKSAS